MFEKYEFSEEKKREMYLKWRNLLSKFEVK